MAEQYPPGTFVQAKSTHSPLITAGKIYEVVPEDCYYSAGATRSKEPWVWIKQDTGGYNGWKADYFIVVSDKNPLPDPEFSLEEIENAQHVYEALNGDK